MTACRESGNRKNYTHENNYGKLFQIMKQKKPVT